MPSTTATGDSSSSNRRQPVRQTRTQPPKYAFSKTTVGGRTTPGGPGDEQLTSEPGFYPALTHFTDSITALPKEMLRHFGMFKEVDSKIYNPEESLKALVADVLLTPQPPPFLEAARAFDARSRAQSDVLSATNSVNGNGGTAMASGPSQTSYNSQINALEAYDVPRRQTFFKFRYFVTEMLPVLEEKNHVISSATDELGRQLMRCESSWSELEKEFSEETRWGNLHHWAYADRSAEKKDARVERPRREAAGHHNFASVQDDFGAVRGTGKRRAQQAQIENEIEETRANKRLLGAGKTKKSTANHASAVGLGLNTGVTYTVSKKRKPEDANSAPLPPMERSMSSIFGKGITGKGNSSPRSRSPAAAKRVRTVGAVGNSTKGRARAGTGISVNEVALATPSPAVGFTASSRPSASPAVGAVMQRQPSARARQNSTQNATVTSHPKQLNTSQPTPSMETAPQPVKVAARTPKIDPGHDDMETRSSTVKREDSITSRHRPPNIMTGSRASGKASKNATPVHASFAETPAASRPRSNRTANVADAGMNRSSAANAGSPVIPAAPKRSHKKGASISAIQQREDTAAASRATTLSSGGTGTRDNIRDIAADEEEGNSERYCYCGGPSYGDMVGCDGEGCVREWFHLDCIGLSKVPPAKGKWYCDECKKRVKI